MQTPGGHKREETDDSGVLVSGQLKGISSIETTGIVQKQQS